ncbi:MAG: hypothetical protein GY942_21425, partial [Aestuariibacter sp.]|nr:hypothetical protein [Aestuariibacter sp.]
DGIVTTSFGVSNDYAYRTTVQADGKILVMGESNIDGDYDFALVRYTTDGSLDTTFDSDGIVTTDFGNGDDYTYDIVTQSDGKILVVGQSPNGSNDDISLGRYNADGSLATSSNLVTTLDGATSFTEGGAAVVLDSNVVVSDVELDALNGGSGNYSGATVTLVRNGGANSDDVYSETGTLSALTESGNLLVGGTTIGTVTTNSGGTLVLTFDSNATTALVNSSLQQIAYSNSSDTPSASAQIDWSFDDDNSGSQGTGGALQAIGSTTVTITAENDAPVVTASGGVTSYSEQATAMVIDSAISINDPDGYDGVDPSAQYVANIQITGNYEATDILGFTDTANIQGNLVGDTLTLTVIGGQTASVAEFQAALRTVTFYNGSDTPSELNRTISFYFDDGVDSSNVSTKTVQVTAVNDAPTVSATATNPTYTEGDAVVDLFNTVVVSTVESGQTIEQIVLTVTNVTDGSDETMTIDGSVAFLVDGDNDTTGSGYDYMVDVIGNTATITIDTTGA